MIDPKILYEYPYRYWYINLMQKLMNDGLTPMVNMQNLIQLQRHTINLIEECINYQHDGSMTIYGSFVYFKNEGDFLMVQLKFG